MNPPGNTSPVANALSITEDRGGVDRHSLARGGVVILAIMIIGLAFVWSFVGGLHQPTFHRVPIAVLGPPALAHALSSSGQFAVTPVDSRQGAVSRIDAHKALGGIVVGQRGIDVLVASVSGLTVAGALRTDLPPKLRTLAGPGTPIRVLDLKPAPRNDPLGLSPFYLALAVTVCNYIGAVFFGLAFGVKPMGRRVWWRLLGVGTVALFLALGDVAVVYAIGPLHGHYVPLVLASLLLGLAVAVMTVGLQSLFGILGTAVAILAFIVLGNPASGGPLPTQVLPGIWRTLGPYLPGGAGTSLIRNIAYFGGQNLTQPLLVLFTWLAVGAAFVLTSIHIRPLGLQTKPDFDLQAAKRGALRNAPHTARDRAA